MDLTITIVIDIEISDLLIELLYLKRKHVLGWQGYIKDTVIAKGQLFL